jgi:hypothetical protein
MTFIEPLRRLRSAPLPLPPRPATAAAAAAAAAAPAPTLLPRPSLSRAAYDDLLHLLPPCVHTCASADPFALREAAALFATTRRSLFPFPFHRATRGASQRRVPLTPGEAGQSIGMLR